MPPTIMAIDPAAGFTVVSTQAPAAPTTSRAKSPKVLTMVPSMLIAGPVTSVAPAPPVAVTGAAGEVERAAVVAAGALYIA